MSSIKKFQCGFVILALGVLSHGARGSVLFDNLNTPLGFFNPGTNQVGDQVVLAGGGAAITSFKFEYFGSNILGGAQAQVFFYANDGSLVSGYASPGTQIWSSGAFTIPDTFNATLMTNALVSFDLSSAPVTVPADFTWAVVFTGVGAGQSAGTILSSAAPTTGSDYNDYWLNTGTVATPNWQLMTNATYNIDFLAQFSSVPEPASFNLLAVGGLIGLAVMLFKRFLARA